MEEKDALPARFTLASAAGRRVIVVLAVGQALLLLAFFEAAAREWALAQDLRFSAVYLTVVVLGPATAALLLDDPRRRAPWLCAGALALALVPLALYAGSQGEAATAHHVNAEALLRTYALAALLIWFISIAFFRARLAGRPFDYAAVDEAAWHHGLTLAVTALLTGLLWLLLALWAALFDVLGVSLFEDVFFDRRFAAPTSGLAAGYGLVLGRSQTDATLTVRRVLFLVVRALLPLLALLTLVFLAALPFTGLTPLWETDSAAALLIALMALMTIFLNGTVQESLRRSSLPYPAPLRRLVEAGVVAYPACGALAAWALALRVQQYGWTPERFWGAVVIGGLGSYALAAAAAALWPLWNSGGRWMAKLRPVNLAWLLALLAVLVLAHTPVLDPYRIAVRSQVTRLKSGTADAEVLSFLRFEAGARGWRALKRLQREDALAGHPQLASRIDAVLRDTARYGRAEPTTNATPADLRTALDVVPASQAVPSELLSVLVNQPPARHCLRPGPRCLLLAADLYDGTPSEYVLFADHDRLVQSYVFAARPDSTWEQTGQLETLRGARADSLLQALRAGRVRTTPSRWRDLVVGGVRLEAR